MEQLSTIIVSAAPPPKHVAVPIANARAAATAPLASATTATPTAPEERSERLAKATIHETVRDRIAATGRIGEQLAAADGRIAERLVHEFRFEQHQRVDDIQRCPAEEELQHNDEQHLDDAPAILHVLLGIGP